MADQITYTSGGAYGSDGSFDSYNPENPGTPNTFTGAEYNSGTTLQYSSYFGFDVSAQHVVRSAALVLQPEQYYSQDPSIAVDFTAVANPGLVEQQQGNGAAYSALTTGGAYATQVFTTADVGNQVTIDLGGSAVADFNAAVGGANGGQFVIGASAPGATNIDPNVPQNTSSDDAIRFTQVYYPDGFQPTLDLVYDTGPTVDTVNATVSAGQTVDLLAQIIAASHGQLGTDTVTITGESSLGTLGGVTADLSESNAALDYLRYVAPTSVTAGTVDQFTYTATDQLGATATGTVDITLNPALVAGGVSVLVAPSSTTDLTAQVLGAVGLPQPGDSVTITGDGTAGTHGTVTLGQNGAIAYRAAPGYAGADSFTYTVTDQFGATATGTVDIAVDSGPTADTVLASAASGQTIDLLSRILMASHGQGTISLVGGSASGTIGSLAITPGSVSYVAPASLLAGAMLVDSFTYTVADQFGLTATGTVDVSVTQAAHVIKSTTAGDMIPGTGGADLITASGAGDTIIGNGGNDKITSTGGSAAIYVTGSAYAGVSLGASNANVVVGGNGNIAVQSTGGNRDNVMLGGGSDTVTLSGRLNTVVLGNGNDTVIAGISSDTINLGTGTSAVFLGAHDTLITAGSGTITDSGTADKITTQAGGTDTITLAGSNNAVTTGGANDTITDAAGGHSHFMLHGGGTEVIDHFNHTSQIVLASADYASTSAALNAVHYSGSGATLSASLSIGGGTVTLNGLSGVLHTSNFSIVG